MHWRCSSTTRWPKGFLVFRLWRSRRILRQKLLHRFLLLQLHTLLQKKSFSSSTVLLGTQMNPKKGVVVCGCMWYVVVEVSRQTVTRLLILAMPSLLSLPFGFQLAPDVFQCCFKVETSRSNSAKRITFPFLSKFTSVSLFKSFFASGSSEPFSERVRRLSRTW